MCLTIPLKIKAIKKEMAELSDGRKVSIALIKSPRVGDWILHTNGYLIKKISSNEADEINKLLNSYSVADSTKISLRLVKTFEAAARGNLKKADIKYLLDLDRPIELQALYSEANIIRKTNIKDHICIHGLVEFSNHCCNNCHYCGLRRDNKKNNLFRMGIDEIINVCDQIVNDRGYKIIVLQSGDDFWYDDDKLTALIKGIKEKCRVFLYLSIGDRSLGTYRQLKRAGANGVLYRFETSNSELYAKLHPGKILKERLDNLRAMEKMGFTISTGSIIGLPGQTVDDLANDILLMKELGAFMPSMGPLIPSQNTPLAQAKIIDFNLLLKMIAAVRLVMPTARIPVTTAMETIGGADSRHQAFRAGANSVMFNLTPDKYRKHYNIYDNKFYDKEKKYEHWALFKGDLSYQMLEDELKVKI